MSVLRPRRGIPRFARKVMAGEPATIVVFGSSLSLLSRCGVRVGGWYLDLLPATLREQTGNACVKFINVGLEGFTSLWAAHRVRDDVLPHGPDLVILEFAHNDNGFFVPMIAPAVDGIVAQVREVNPDCEFAAVLFARAGAAAGGPSEAMLAYEDVADFYGFPTFDLATLAERVVADGKATWMGDPQTALSTDGSHLTALATPLIGAPFAEAFAEMLRRSLEIDEMPPARPVGVPVSLRARRSALRPFVDGQWAVGPPLDSMHCRRPVAAYLDEIASASAPGASAKFAFTGTRAQVWVLIAGGTIGIVFDGERRWSHIGEGDGTTWGFVDLATDVPEGLHHIEIVALKLPLVLGDVFVIGEFV